MNNNKNLHELSLQPNVDKKDLYNKWADTYEDYVNDLNYIGPNNLVKNLENYIDSNNNNILDFGCGTGLLGLAVSKKFKNINIDGIDISHKMIEICKKKNIYRDIWNINLFDKKLDINNLYDLVISCGVFLEGHVSFKMINILTNYLKKDGIICFSIRETFIIEKKEEYNKYIKENKKIKIINDLYIDYLPNVKCKLLILKRLI